MSIYAKSGSDRQLIPPGNHVARCHRIVEVGQIPDNFNPEKFKKLVHISYELPTVLLKNGRPFAIGKLYTLSTHKKSSLRALIES